MAAEVESQVAGRRSVVVERIPIFSSGDPMISALFPMHLRVRAVTMWFFKKKQKTSGPSVLFLAAVSTSLREMIMFFNRNKKKKK
jgi:hypothetical protein